jgi:7-cyano-7-deazaguanine synthase
VASSVLILSGGIDSTVLLAHLLARGSQVRALTLDYGQRHRREIESAQAVAAHYGVEHRIADLRAVAGLMGDNALTDRSVEVPEGHYQAESMKATVVPNRNMLFLSLAGSWAVATRSDSVVYGAHGGDHAIYPDCRPEFAEAMDRALALCDWHTVRLERPFVDWDKAAIVRRGVELGAPLALTWSCYVGGSKPCGRCGTCVERREAFEQAGVSDPAPYA